jgi:hypothetical protein
MPFANTAPAQFENSGFRAGMEEGNTGELSPPYRGETALFHERVVGIPENHFSPGVSAQGGRGIHRVGRSVDLAAKGRHPKIPTGIAGELR